MRSATRWIGSRFAGPPHLRDSRRCHFPGGGPCGPGRLPGDGAWPGAPHRSRSPFFHCLGLGVYRAVTGRAVMLSLMADFLAVAGIVVFVAAMLGLISGLDRVWPASRASCSPWLSPC